MQIGRSANALMRRGLDSLLAEQLVSQGYTLTKLKELSAKKLHKLGVSANAAKKIHSERTPIPPDTLYRLLYDNAYSCCVCRDRTLSIIVHHIEEWAKSRSHDPSNLAVLCLQHHDKAHSRSDLSQNLTPVSLRHAKAAWETEVKTFVAKNILDVGRLQSDCWLYFNHLRLWEMAKAAGITLAKLPSSSCALQARLIDKDGMLRPRSATLPYMYSGGEGMTLYAFAKDVIEAVLAKTRIVNISDNLDRTTLPPLLGIGDIVFVQGAHDFKLESDFKRGAGQSVRGVRRANHIRVEFVIDRWEATSNSAWGMWLSGRQSVGTLLQLKTIDRNGDVMILRGTAIGILNGAQTLKTRGYEGSMGHQRFYDPGEDEELEPFELEDEL